MKQVRILCAILLSFFIVQTISTSQPRTVKIPCFFSGQGGAMVCGGINDVNIIAIAETSWYTPIPENSYTRGFVYAIRYDSSGKFGKKTVIDTVSSVSFGFGGNSVNCTFDGIEDGNGDLFLVINHAKNGWGDIWPFLDPLDLQVRCKVLSAADTLKDILTLTGVNNGQIASDASGSIHLVYESLVSLENSPYRSFSRARSTIIHRTIDRSSGGISLSSTIDTLGIGFAPQVNTGGHQTAYVSWLACDSTWSSTATVMLARVTTAGIKKFSLMNFNFQNPSYPPMLWKLPELHLSVNENGIAWISWIRQYRDTVLYVAHVSPDNTVQIDSLHVANTGIYDHSLQSDSHGRVYVAWIANSQNTLYLSASDTLHPVFEKIRAITGVPWPCNPHLVKNIRGEVSCIYNNGNGIGYIRDLWDTHSPMALIDRATLATYTRPDYYSNVYKNSVMIDAKGKLFVAFNKSFAGDSSAIGLTLFSEDESMLNVGRENPKIALNFSLAQNYPNPFNPATTFSYSIPHAGHVTVRIFDIVGREIANPVHEIQNAGNHTFQWDASMLAGGVYFYRLESGGRSETKKLLLLK